MRASPGGPYTEYAPAGTPRTSARNLTLGVVTVRSARGYRRRVLVPLGANMGAFR
jgi:hypothetical protein